MAVTAPEKTASKTNDVLRQLYELGQSIWLDNISRHLIASGELQRLVDEGVQGMTSNPTIFEKAIAGSADYDAQMTELARQGKSTRDVFIGLAVKDIQNAADVLRPVYERLHGADGYVSLEVMPDLANDTQGTIEQAQQLWKLVDRPNIFIKIPATAEGVPAIAACVGMGLNINVTLLFDVDRYEEVANAYIEGLETLHKAGKPLGRVVSVASFFVSRVDTLVDKLLEGKPQQRELQGTAAVANAKVAYERFGKIFGTERFARLKADGAKVQRVLWASTSTKNPAYSDLKYVEPLIGADTVNTVPAQTLEAIKDHLRPARSVDRGVDEAHQHLKSLAAAGIDMKAVGKQLEEEGVAAFAKSFDDLLASTEKKIKQIAGGK